MNFDVLCKILPKLPQNWNQKDVGIWLKFIGYEKYQQTFSIFEINKVQNSIDGTSIYLLDNDDLKNELKIDLLIERKKILHWTQNILKQYANYLISNKKILDNDVDFLVQIDKAMNQKNKQQNQAQTDLDNNQQDQNKINGETEEKKVESLIYLIPIQNDEGQYFQFNEAGGTIGRQAINDIVIVDDRVSKMHAQIYYNQKQFFIKDNNSFTGTFLQLIDKKEIQQGEIYELGSSLYQFDKIEKQQDTFNIQISITGGPSYVSILNFTLNDYQYYYKIGRTCDQNFSVPCDQYMTGYHARVVRKDNKIFLEDMKSMNGCWKKIIHSENQQPEYLLIDNDCIKIGQVCTFRVKIDYATQQIALQNYRASQDCIICCDSERDTIHMPCRHNISCWTCSQKLTQCPICKVKIEDLIKIYKS